VTTARHLRQAVNKLVTEGQVSGTLKETMSLTNIFINEIGVDDYLTLLVHLGILSVSEPESGSGYVFKISSGAYKEKYLDSLLKSSLGELFALITLKEVYDQGVDLIKDFLATLSATGMSSLIDWAALHENNNFMELQLQGFMIGELHDELYGIATVEQGDLLPTSKRSDITLQGNHVLVVLELKKLNGPTPPTEAQKIAYHDQLRGYVTTRNEMEAKEKKRPVAGFIVVQYAGGRHYIVEKLTPEASAKQLPASRRSRRYASTAEDKKRAKKHKNAHKKKSKEDKKY
jgi:hypothetical protein